MEWLTSNIQYYLKFSESEKALVCEYDRIINEAKEEGLKLKEKDRKPDWIKILKETSYEKQSRMTAGFFVNGMIVKKHKELIETMMKKKNENEEEENTLVQKTIFGLAKGGNQYVKQQLEHNNMKTKVVNTNILLILKPLLMAYSKYVNKKNPDGVKAIMENEEKETFDPKEIERRTSMKKYYFNEIVYQKLLTLLLPLADASKNKDPQSVMMAMEIIAFLLRSIHYEPILRMVYNSSIQLLRLTFERIQWCHEFLQQTPHKSYRKTIIYAYSIVSSILEFRNYKYVNYACSQFPLDKPTIINIIWEHICGTSIKGNNEYTQMIALPAVHSMVYLAMHNHEVRKLLIQYKPLKEKLALLLYDFINMNDDPKHIYSAEFTKCAFKFCYLLWGHKEFQIPFITLELKRDANPHHHLINHLQLFVSQQSKLYNNNISLFIYLIETLDRLVTKAYDDLEILTLYDYEIAEIALKMLVELCYEFEEIVIKDLHAIKQLEKDFMKTLKKVMQALVDDSMTRLANEKAQKRVLHQLRFGLASLLQLFNFLFRDDVHTVSENIHKPLMKMERIFENAILILQETRKPSRERAYVKLPELESKSIDQSITMGLQELMDYIDYFESLEDDSDKSYEGFFN